MKKTSKYTLFLSSCFLLWAVVVEGQVITPLSLQSNISFSSYGDLMAGSTQQNRLTIQIVCTCTGLLLPGPYPDWTLKVRAYGDYETQQGQTIPLQYTSLKFNNVSISNMAPANQGIIPLSTTNTTIVSGTPQLIGVVLLQYQFDFIVQGGNHLLKPDGNYYTTLEIGLYDKNNVRQAYTVLPNFGIEISAGNALEYTTIELQNGADDINFVFDSPSDYLNGITVSKPLGLKVESTQPHEIKVKTNTAQLISQNTSNTIPVSKFQIKASLNQSTTGITTEPPTPLSPNETLLFTNSRDPGVTFLFAETYEYDLEYSLPAGSADQGLGPPATYSTQVYFIVIPQ